MSASDWRLGGHLRYRKNGQYVEENWRPDEKQEEAPDEPIKESLDEETVRTLRTNPSYEARKSQPQADIAPAV